MGSMLHLLGEKCLTIYLGNLFDRFNYLAVFNDIFLPVEVQPVLLLGYFLWLIS